MTTDTYNHVHSILTAPDVVDRLERERDNPLFSFINTYMVGCEHVNYHHEGDVWQHTKLVISNRIKFDHDYLDVAAALLHDIGKKTALEQNGGKNMAGHELLGIPYAADVLSGFDFNDDEKELVLWLVQNHTKANDLPKTTSKYSCWSLVTHPWYNRLERLVIADSEGTIGTDGKPVIDFMAALRENKISAYCMSHSMPSHLVTWDDVQSQHLDDAGMMFEFYELCHKIQINGGSTKKTSIIKSALKCMRDKYKKETK